VPWEGRTFEPTAFGGDDGSAPEVLAQALAAFRRGECDQAAVVGALRTSRLLIPLVAALGGSTADHDGLAAAGADDAHVDTLGDKSADLSIVTVAGPDGRAVMPVFSSVQSMAAWNRDARPVPVDAVRVALAAASENTDLVVLDPTAPTEFAVRRPALWAIAQGARWVPGRDVAEVLAAFAASVSGEDAVLGLDLADGDPAARLAGPEVIVRLTLADGLDDGSLDALMHRLGQRWSTSEAIALSVDSLAVRLDRADRPGLS
jgi:hypothetical protein